MFFTTVFPRPNEPPPGVHFTFEMIKTVSVEAALALSGGRSSCSR